MLFVSLVLSFSKFIHIRTYFSLSMGSLNFSRRGSWRGIWNYCWFILFSRLQFGSVAAKHDSSIAAFAMASIQVACLGIEWCSQFRISCHRPELGTWLRTPWGADCTVLAKANWQASEQTMKSQSPFICKKKLPKASKDKGGLWSSQTLASGGRWLFGCFGSACPRSEEGCFGPASDSGSLHRP